MKTGLIVSNLGSPSSPYPASVKRYLREFLNDPYVIDIAPFWRNILVNGIILNLRPKKTAKAYQKIWTERGSPLRAHTEVLTQKLREKLEMPVAYAMRYGPPQVDFAIQSLLDQGVDHFIFLPLYPQYSYAASETAIVQFEDALKKISPNSTFHVIEDFYSNPQYIAALSDSFREPLARFKPDLLLLSYHGVPVRQLFKTRNKKNYQEHCLATTEALRVNLGLRHDQIFTSFQSRLGRTPWVAPYTDYVIPELVQKGMKKILVASPSFTADCLETLEEIQMQYRELFEESGGEHFEYVPCLNTRDSFIDALSAIVAQFELQTG